MAEFKYDGQRAQIHAIREPNKIPNVKIFSRHLEDMTSKVDIQTPHACDQS
jgi:DNA ligase 1